MPKAHRKLFERQQTDNEELRAQVELLTDSNRRLEHLVSELRRAIYDKRSEKRPMSARQLAFEDLESPVAEVEEAVAAAGDASSSPERKRRAPRRNLGHLPKDLERVEHIIKPESTECPGIAKHRSTPVRGWSWTVPRWPAGWARRRFT